MASASGNRKPGGIWEPSPAPPCRGHRKEQSRSASRELGRVPIKLYLQNRGWAGFAGGYCGLRILSDI